MSGYYRSTQGHCQGIVLPHEQAVRVCGHWDGCCWEPTQHPLQDRIDLAHEKLDRLIERFPPSLHLEAAADALRSALVGGD